MRIQNNPRPVKMGMSLSVRHFGSHKRVNSEEQTAQRSIQCDKVQST